MHVHRSICLNSNCIELAGSVICYAIEYMKKNLFLQISILQFAINRFSLLKPILFLNHTGS